MEIKVDEETEVVEICDEKYTLIYNKKNGDFKCLRYGESWRDLIGDKMVFALFCELREIKEQAARKVIQKHEEQIERLKKLCRYQFLTLGYYGAEFNYDDKNIVYHPITNQVASGIKHDNGAQARETKEVAEQLGFTPEEIRSWRGPKV